MPKDPDISNAPIGADEQYCRTCRFYEFTDSREQDQLGTCLRYAPRPQLVTTENPKELFYAEWPTVRCNDWCGDWQREPLLDQPDEA